MSRALSRFTALVGREIRGYFYSPLAYFVMAVFLSIQGLVFWMLLSALNNPQMGLGIGIMQFFFGGTFFFWFTLLVICPLLTMRLFSEEKRSGTMEVLMTAPVTDLEIVLSKFLACLLFYALLWVPTVLFVVFMWQVQPGFDLGPVWGGYLGTLLLGSFFLSSGCLASALTRNQIIAAVLSFGFLLVLLSAGLMAQFLRGWGIGDVLEYVAVLESFAEFSKGILDTRWVLYYSSATALNLFLTLRVLESARWR